MAYLDSTKIKAFNHHMALRVLLADESSTIKKVISLALQDFAVEVKVVHSGVDVVEVAKQFNPDIIFADVLLQKKNGYEVCFDVKNDASLSQIPVILMWSSFMDLDEKAYQKSKANAKLEKPFEVDDLRKLVNTFATKTREQTASGFLKFPSSMTDSLKSEVKEKESQAVSEDTFSRLGIPAPPPNNRVTGNVAPPIKSQPQATAQAPAAPPKANANWNMDSFEDIQVFTEQADDPTKDLNKSLEDFSELRLTPLKKDASDNMESWEQKDLSNFKIDTSEEEDPFSMMDLGKVEVTQSGQKAFPTLSVTSSGRKASVPKAAPGPNESFQTFDFADSESLNLELDDVEPTKAAVNPNPEGSSSWNFQLPEHEVSPVKPGDILELPPEFSEPEKPEKSEISALAEHALSGNAPPRQEKPKAPPPQQAQRPAPRAEAPVEASFDGGTDNALIEKVVREQTRELVEKIIQKILPDMAKQMIQQELDRLLNEENLP